MRRDPFIPGAICDGLGGLLVELHIIMRQRQARCRADLLGAHAGGLFTAFRVDHPTVVLPLPQPDVTGQLHLPVRGLRDQLRAILPAFRGHPAAVDQHRGAVRGLEWRDDLVGGRGLHGAVAQQDLLLRQQLSLQSDVTPLLGLLDRLLRILGQHLRDRHGGLFHRGLEAIVKLRALRVFTQLPGRQGVEGEVGEQQHENSREDPAWRQKSSKAALRLLAALWIDRHRVFLPLGLAAVRDRLSNTRVTSINSSPPSPALKKRRRPTPPRLPKQKPAQQRQNRVK